MNCKEINKVATIELSAYEVELILDAFKSICDATHEIPRDIKQNYERLVFQFKGIEWDD